jgi:hypothetical protein
MGIAGPARRWRQEMNALHAFLNAFESMTRVDQDASWSARSQARLSIGTPQACRPVWKVG